MLRKNPKKQKPNMANKELEAMRITTFKDLQPAVPEAIKHVLESLKATESCPACRGTKKLSYNDGRNAWEEECSACSGTGKIENTKQRNWASEHIINRFAPVPKSVEFTEKPEMTTSKARSIVENLPENVVEEALRALRSHEKTSEQK